MEEGLKCPECQAEIVFQGDIITSAFFFNESFTGDNGLEHRHDNYNLQHKPYECHNGHRGHLVSRPQCPSCDWSKQSEKLVSLQQVKENRESRHCDVATTYKQFQVEFDLEKFVREIETVWYMILLCLLFIITM